MTALPSETRSTLPAEARSSGRGDALASFEELVERLSIHSVQKHFDAYEDVDWDSPAFAVERTDPRWELPADVNGLGSTTWYRSLPPETRAEIGLYLVATFMKTGLQFESVLKRGLLELAFDLPNGDPKFRYAYHEVIEEAQHSLMFQEFVNRTGFDIQGLGWRERRASRFIVSLGRRFPELFLMFVLGGEDPIDHVQREALRNDRDMPPILERIIRIHVTEEARHLSFARHYLKLRAPEIGAVRRMVLGIGTPIILGVMAQQMMRPSRSMIRRYSIPREVVREAYTDNPDHAQRTKDALRKVRRLGEEIGIVNAMTKPIWKLLGIWDDASDPAPAR